MRREEIIELSKLAQKDCECVYKEIDEICEYNSLKVLNAFQDNNISEIHFGGTTGYGYDDIGRDKIESVFSQIFKSEDSLVRTQFISGTHALTVTLFAVLRPGDTILSLNGKPYDTLDKVIGITKNDSSLASYGIKYEQIDLTDNDFDIESIEKRIKKGGIKLAIVQRSRGYSSRQSLDIKKIKKAIGAVKNINEDVIVMVDNCYGEFVEKIEPVEIGADLVVGSLIKNLGGGIVPNGGYVVGRTDLVELAGERLTSPGQGKEVGPTLGINKYILQGIFMAPHIVSQSLKTSVFASYMLEKLGYSVFPKYNQYRTDIVQTIEFNDRNKMIKFCQGIQMGSPIDSNVIPEPWDMPGYNNKVIMAAGTFTQGSSIELSCDAPVVSPYRAFLQGGLTYEYGKLGVLKAIENMIK